MKKLKNITQRDTEEAQRRGDRENGRMGEWVKGRLIPPLKGARGM
jgi:hypothetical protein